MMRIINVNGWV